MPSTTTFTSTCGNPVRKGGGRGWPPWTPSSHCTRARSSRGTSAPAGMTGRKLSRRPASTSATSTAPSRQRIRRGSYMTGFWRSIQTALTLACSGGRRARLSPSADLRVRRQVFLGPAGDLVKCRQERLAAVGQSVGNGDGRAGLDCACDQTRSGKLSEPLREDTVGDRSDRARELPETRRPVAQDPEDHRVPALAEEAERPRERGVAAFAGFGGLARRGEPRRAGHVHILSLPLGNTTIFEVATLVEARPSAPADGLSPIERLSHGRCDGNQVTPGGARRWPRRAGCCPA